jgi:hypothetical protein
MRSQRLGRGRQQRIEQQRIDGEIAPQDVLPCIAFKSHFHRMTAVHVGMIAAKRGDLDAFHQHYTELRAHQLGLGKNLNELARQGIGSDVVIRRFTAQNKIANASADQPALERARSEFLGDLNRRAKPHVIIVG